MACDRNTTPASRKADAARYFLDRSVTPPRGDARRGMPLLYRAPAREPSKDWSLDPADILPLSGNESPARLRRLNNLVGDFVVESDHW